MTLLLLLCVFQPGSPTLKVLQISDVHWDPEYVEGSNAVCGEPLCCRPSSGNLSDPSHAAGYWGDYRTCDIPMRTIEKALGHMSRQHPVRCPRSIQFLLNVEEETTVSTTIRFLSQDVDYIIWTGDLIPHNVWSSDRSENVLIMRKLINLFRQYFPTTPIYPTLGNHEGSPVNS